MFSFISRFKLKFFNDIAQSLFIVVITEYLLHLYRSFRICVTSYLQWGDNNWLAHTH